MTEELTAEAREALEKEVEAFIDKVADGLPDQMPLSEVVRLVCIVVSAYTTDVRDLHNVMLAATAHMLAAIAETEAMPPHDECDCPSCTAKRKAMAH